MNPPFSAEQFFEVFSAYNTAVWPIQILLLGLGVTAVVLARGGDGWRGKVISLTLAFLWAWMGVAYHWAFFKAINPAAGMFGVLFLAQAGLLVWFGLRANGLRYGPRSDVCGFVGGFFLAYGLAIYPIIGLLSGRPYLNQPSFGLPCPTAIFTVGLLLWAKPRVPWALLIVPAAWSIIGFTAARAFGVMEDIMLPVAGIIGGALIVWRNRTRAARAGGDPVSHEPSRAHLAANS